MYPVHPEGAQRVEGLQPVHPEGAQRVEGRQAQCERSFIRMIFSTAVNNRR